MPQRITTLPQPSVSSHQTHHIDDRIQVQEDPSSGEDDDEDEADACKENNPSLSPLPVSPPRPPPSAMSLFPNGSPRRNVLGKRPLSTLPTPADPDSLVDVDDDGLSRRDADTMSPSEQNIANNKNPSVIEFMNEDRDGGDDDEPGAANESGRRKVPKLFHHEHGLAIRGVSMSFSGRLSHGQVENGNGNAEDGMTSASIDTGAGDSAFRIDAVATEELVSADSTVVSIPSVHLTPDDSTVISIPSIHLTPDAPVLSSLPTTVSVSHSSSNLARKGKENSDVVIDAYGNTMKEERESEAQRWRPTKSDGETKERQKDVEVISCSRRTTTPTTSSSTSITPGLASMTFHALGAAPVPTGVGKAGSGNVTTTMGNGSGSGKVRSGSGSASGSGTGTTWMKPRTGLRRL